MGIWEQGNEAETRRRLFILTGGRMRHSKTFNEKISRLFYVPDIDAMVDDIASQIKTGFATHIGTSLWLINIFDIPAVVVISGECLKMNQIIFKC